MTKNKRGGFTYLSWECKLPLLSEKSFHLTAKFLGTIAVDSSEVQNKIKGIKTSITEQVTWQTTVFNTPRGPVYVLELTHFPPQLNQIHDALASLYPDDHPTYRPHITLPKELWEQINTQEMTPEQAGLVFGQLELRVLGVKTANF